MRRVTICEFQRVPIAAPDDSVVADSYYVTPEEADSIQQASGRFGCSRPREWFSIIRTGGRSFLKAGCWVGLISVGELRLEVVPKVGTDEEGVALGPPAVSAQAIDLMEMLVVTNKLPSRLRAVRGGQGMERMIDSVLRWYMQSMNSAINMGLIRGYCELEGDHPSFKGRLDTNRFWINKCLRRPLVACKFDDFIEDTVLNRILKAGLRSALSLAASLGLKYSIKNTLSVMDGVADVSFTPKHARGYALSRREERFAALHSAACFFIEGLSPDPVSPMKLAQPKITKAVGVLFNMEKLFEDYVFKMLSVGGKSQGRRFVVPGHVISAQEHDRKASALVWDRPSGSNYFGLKPDLVFRDESSSDIVLIADTKWKRINDQVSSDSAKAEEVVKVGSLGVRQADVYQLFAYAEYFGTKARAVDVVLIYPQDPRLESTANCEAALGFNDIGLKALPSVGKIGWEFIPKSRPPGQRANLRIKVFPLPLVDSARPALASTTGAAYFSSALAEAKGT